MNLRTCCLLILFLLICIVNSSLAADLFVHLQDETLLTITLSDIDNISFDESSSSLTISMSNGSNDTFSISDIRKLSFGNLSEISESELDLINRFTLLRNYPNPFNSSTTVEYVLPKPGKVKIAIYNISGQLVRNLYEKEQQAGLQRINWDGLSDSGAQIASGMYICKVSFEQEQLVSRLIFIK
jgi:FlgD Ig-like domain